MLVAEYIADFFDKKGIRDVFFIDGSACASMLVAVAQNKKLTYYCPRHEQAGSFAVDGYYKASGRVSAMIATSGPAGQNLLNGIAASFYDSMPALYLTGQVNSRFVKPTPELRQRGFQENDIVSMAIPVTKYAVMLTKAEDIRYELEKAYHIMTTGRPGPVLIDVPMDIQKTNVDEKKLRKFEPPQNESAIVQNNKKLIDRCIKMLKEAQRPSLLIGGGVWLAKANDEMMQLIEKLKIPFFVTWNMIDFCENNHPLYGGRVGTFGGDGRNFGIQNSDFLLAVGSRIPGRITGGMIHTFARAAKKVFVDIDPVELKYQEVKADINICSDAKIFIDEFSKSLENNPGLKDYSQWTEKVKGWKKRYTVFQKSYLEQKGSVNPYVFIKVLSEEMKDGDVMVHEAGGNCVITSQTYEAKKNQRVFSNNGNSSLGYSLPAAIGACIATKKPVICITGDGGLNFNIQELQTLKYYKLPVKIMVFNNYAYGITKLYRDTNFDSEYAGVDGEHGVENPDFKKVASAYGIKAVHIKDHEHLREKVRGVLDANEAILCDINMIGFYDYKPRLGWGTPIEDQYPFLPRNEFKKNMIIEPFEGWEDPVYPGKIK